MVQWAHKPLVYVPSGGDPVALVKEVVTFDLTAAYSVGPVRIGAHIPVILRGTSDVLEGQTGLGDLALDGKLRVIDRYSTGFGVAVTGRIGLPTSTMSGALGADGLGGELALVVDKELGPALLSANLGARFAPEVALENLNWGDQGFLRLGFGYPVSDTAGISADLAAQSNFKSFFQPYANPAEILLGGWARPGDGGLTVRGGVGTGLNNGVGAPQLRAMLGLSFSPLRVPPVPPVVDTDGDGLFDDVDACINEPEVVNSYEDEDGCPDALGAVAVKVVSADGSPAAGAKLKWGDEEIVVPEDGLVRREGLMPGSSFSVAADLKDHTPSSPLAIDVVEGEEKAVEVRLVLLPGSIKVTVQDEKKQPVDAMLKFEPVKTDARVGADTKLPTKRFAEATGPDGEHLAAVPPGKWTLSVVAEGFRVENRPLEVAPGQVLEPMVILLKPAKVKVTKEALVIVDKVFFDTGKATVKAESLPLLQEVAETLKANPQVKLVEVQGHTDNKGKLAYNMDLSQRRVDSVREYLISQGVEPARLVSKGYGPNVPIADNATEAGRAENRRVQFVILEQEAVVIEVEQGAIPGDTKGAGAPAPADTKGAEAPAPADTKGAEAPAPADTKGAPAPQ
jgi:outer membrane protein OmpA-like peptidoglycan-associated protein